MVVVDHNFYDVLGKIFLSCDQRDWHSYGSSAGSQRSCTTRKYVVQQYHTQATLYSPSKKAVIGNLGLVELRLLERGDQNANSTK